MPEIHGDRSILLGLLGAEEVAQKRVWRIIIIII